MSMTRKDFKIIADALKALITALRKSYVNFDSVKFKDYLFKEDK
jgi:hypothetical protein